MSYAARMETPQIRSQTHFQSPWLSLSPKS
jgi:hypothetical protein